MKYLIVLAITGVILGPGALLIAGMVALLVLALIWVMFQEEVENVLCTMVLSVREFLARVGGILEATVFGVWIAASFIAVLFYGYVIDPWWYPIKEWWWRRQNARDAKVARR